ncbi:hypothetical protein HOG98_08595 [bacterium]|nr:hypothetical protein [bacterium]
MNHKIVSNYLEVFGRIQNLSPSILNQSENTDASLTTKANLSQNKRRASEMEKVSKRKSENHSNKTGDEDLHVIKNKKPRRHLTVTPILDATKKEQTDMLEFRRLLTHLVQTDTSISSFKTKKWIQTQILEEPDLINTEQNFKKKISDVAKLSQLVFYISKHPNKNISKYLINIIFNYVEPMLDEHKTKNTRFISTLIQSLSKCENTEPVRRYVEGFCLKLNTKNALDSVFPIRTASLLYGLAHFSDIETVNQSLHRLKEGLIEKLKLETYESSQVGVLFQAFSMFNDLDLALEFVFSSGDTLISNLYPRKNMLGSKVPNRFESRTVLSIFRCLSKFSEEKGVQDLVRKDLEFCISNMSKNEQYSRTLGHLLLDLSSFSDVEGIKEILNENIEALFETSKLGNAYKIDITQISQGLAHFKDCKNVQNVFGKNISFFTTNFLNAPMGPNDLALNSKSGVVSKLVSSISKFNTQSPVPYVFSQNCSKLVNMFLEFESDPESKAGLINGLSKFSRYRDVRNVLRTTINFILPDGHISGIFPEHISSKLEALSHFSDIPEVKKVIADNIERYLSDFSTLNPSPLNVALALHALSSFTDLNEIYISVDRHALNLLNLIDIDKVSNRNKVKLLFGISDFHGEQPLGNDLLMFLKNKLLSSIDMDSLSEGDRYSLRCIFINLDFLEKSNNQILDDEIPDNEGVQSFFRLTRELSNASDVIIDNSMMVEEADSVLETLSYEETIPVTDESDIVQGQVFSRESKLSVSLTISKKRDINPIVDGEKILPRVYVIVPTQGIVNGTEESDMDIISWLDAFSNSVHDPRKEEKLKTQYVFVIGRNDKEGRTSEEIGASSEFDSSRLDNFLENTPNLDAQIRYVDFTWKTSTGKVPYGSLRNLLLKQVMEIQNNRITSGSSRSKVWGKTYLISMDGDTAMTRNAYLHLRSSMGTTVESKITHLPYKIDSTNGSERANSTNTSLSIASDINSSLVLENTKGERNSFAYLAEPTIGISGKRLEEEFKSNGLSPVLFGISSSDGGALKKSSPNSIHVPPPNSLRASVILSRWSRFYMPIQAPSDPSGKYDSGELLKIVNLLRHQSQNSVGLHNISPGLALVTGNNKATIEMISKYFNYQRILKHLKFSPEKAKGFITSIVNAIESEKDLVTNSFLKDIRRIILKELESIQKKRHKVDLIKGLSIWGISVADAIGKRFGSELLDDNYSIENLSQEQKQEFLTSHPALKKTPTVRKIDKGNVEIHDDSCPNSMEILADGSSERSGQDQENQRVYEEVLKEKDSSMIELPPRSINPDLEAEKENNDDYDSDVDRRDLITSQQTEPTSPIQGNIPGVGLIVDTAPPSPLSEMGRDDSPEVEHRLETPMHAKMVPSKMNYKKQFYYYDENIALERDKLDSLYLKYEDGAEAVKSQLGKKTKTQKSVDMGMATLDRHYFKIENSLEEKDKFLFIYLLLKLRNFQVNIKNIQKVIIYQMDEKISFESLCKE